MNLITWTYPMRLVVALALGFLVGLERESSEVDHKRRVFAGIRTYSIISLFGFACAWLFTLKITLALPVGLLSIAAIVLVEYLAKMKVGRIGWTSEISALLTFVVGALALLADMWVPMALGLTNVLLLSEKDRLENFVESLDKAEFLAVLRFLLVTLIVLPVLPNQGYTQFNLNPARIWQIVILVSSIGFVGYFLSKKLGSKVGLWFSGLLGGIVSSTAVSVAVGRIAQKDPDQSGNALQASILASSVMYLRILVLIGIINPSLIRPLAWKLVLLALIGGMLAIRVRASGMPSGETSVQPAQNPFEIRPALIFALLFAFLSVVTELVKNAFGNPGVLLLSAVVGVTDIDPYVLSLIHNTVQVGGVIVAALIIAMMSNTIIKGVYFGILAKQARKETIWRYGLWAVLHIPFIFLP